MTHFVPDASGAAPPDPYGADPYRTAPAPDPSRAASAANPYEAPSQTSRFDWSATSATRIPTSRTPHVATSDAGSLGYGEPPPWEQQAAASPNYGPTSAAHWLVPVGRSWQSIAAGYLGIIGLFLPVFAPFAIWLGIVALQRAQTGGHGRGRAVFGIVAGGIGLTWGALALLGALL